MNVVDMNGRQGRFKLNAHKEPIRIKNFKLRFKASDKIEPSDVDIALVTHPMMLNMITRPW